MRLFRSAIGAALLCTTVLGAPSHAQSVAEGTGCLAGNWYLVNTDLFLSIVEGSSQSQTGTKFSLQEITGDYIANIDPDGGTVTVTWQNWEMRGTADTQRSGSFPVTVRFDGAQYYDLMSMDDTTMAVSLRRDALNTSVTMGGMSVPNAPNIVPPMAGGTWTCVVNVFTLTSEGRVWTFDRADF